MAMNINRTRFEFELVVKKYGVKYDEYSPRYSPETEKEKEELVEKLEFKSLSAVEVLRKLFDYITSI